MSEQANQFLERRYAESWWPDGKTVWRFSRRYGGGVPRRAGDLMAFDCLNAGMTEVRRVGELLEARPGDRVLDIGCGLGGPGRLLAELQQLAIVGVDLSQVQVDSATELSAALGVEGAARFLRADATSLPFEDAAFAAALAIESIVHVEDKPTAFAELHRVLRPGARVVVADYVAFRRAPRIEALFPLGYHPFAPGEIESLLAARGFRVDVVEDRSTALAAAYEAFERVFAQPHITPRMLLDGFAWWQDGARGVRARLRRAWGFQRFLRERKAAVVRFLGAGREHVIEFCAAQAEACRRGDIRYQLTAATKVAP